MGTTIAMAATTADHYEVAWIGDSRAYLWDGQLRQISQDHSLVQEMVAQGTITVDQARSHPRRNVITQALGVTDPDHLRIGVANDDRSEEHTSELPSPMHISYSVFSLNNKNTKYSNV